MTPLQDFALLIATCFAAVIAVRWWTRFWRGFAIRRIRNERGAYVDPGALHHRELVPPASRGQAGSDLDTTTAGDGGRIHVVSAPVRSAERLDRQSDYARGTTLVAVPQTKRVAVDPWGVSEDRT